MGSDRPSARNERPVVAVFRAPVFNLSEGFVRAQAAGLCRYQPVIVGLHDKGHVPAELAGRVLLPGSRVEWLAMQAGHWALTAARLRPWAPTLVHAHFGTDGLAALPLARLLGVPLVTTLRGYEVNRSRARMIGSGRLSWMRYGLARRWLIEGGQLFLAVSDALRRKAVAQGYPDRRTLTHYNGVDLGRFRPDGAASEPGLILHVGRLVEKKGTALLLDAFAAARAARPEARLVIVGEGPLDAHLRRQAASLGLGDSVRFVGAATAEEVAGWMARAWLLAAPSVTARDGDAEGLPNVVVEAAASALPVVAFDHAGMTEAVSDGRSGSIVSEGDVPALAARLIDLLASPDLQRRMGEEARRIAEERFDAVRQITRLEAIYDEVRADFGPA